MIKEFLPLYDRILVKEIKSSSESQKKSIIFTPDTPNQPALGEVISIGNGRFSNSGRLIPLQVKVGDNVYYRKHSAIPFGEDCFIIREDDIFGTI